MANKITAPDYTVNFVKHLYVGHVNAYNAGYDLEQWVKVKWLIWDKVYGRDYHVGYRKECCHKKP